MNDTFGKLAALPLSQRYSFTGNMCIAVGTALVSVATLLQLVEEGRIPIKDGPVFRSGNSPMDRIQERPKTRSAEYFNS